MNALYRFLSLAVAAAGGAMTAATRSAVLLTEAQARARDSRSLSAQRKPD